MWLLLQMFWILIFVTDERDFEVQQGFSSQVESVPKIIKNGIRHIEASSTTMKCPIDLKMHRDLPESFPNRDLTKFPTSDTFFLGISRHKSSVNFS